MTLWRWILADGRRTLPRRGDGGVSGGGRVDGDLEAPTMNEDRVGGGLVAAGHVNRDLEACRALE